MSEIEKLYENCNIAPQKEGYCGWDCDCPYPDIIRNGCGDRCPYWEYEDEAKYPPFTAEKQIELIKWLSDTYYYIHNIYKTIDTKEYCIENDFYDIQTNKFEEALARLINKLWQDLTEEEKTSIKNILEM
jgi:hypothetical protein